MILLDVRNEFSLQSESPTIPAGEYKRMSNSAGGHPGAVFATHFCLFESQLQACSGLILSQR